MKNSEQQAFPATYMSDNGITSTGGLTKREYIATLLLQGMLSNSANNSSRLYGVNGTDEIGFMALKEITTAAIVQADELLKQLE